MTERRTAPVDGVEGEPHDAMYALVELVRSADERYARLEARGILVTGRIVIEVEERRGARSSVLRVRDDAGEGDARTVNAVAPRFAVRRHDRLVRDIGLHVALRDIVANPARTVIVRRLGRVVAEERVEYREPVHDPELGIHQTATVIGYSDAKVELSMCIALHDLSGAEDGPYRTGGLLVQSGRSLVDCSFFGHEGSPGAERLWGRVRCDGLDTRFVAGERVFAPHRTGLARDHPFVRALIRTVDAMVDPYVLAEQSLALVLDAYSDGHSRRRYGNVVRELNRILVKELHDVPEGSGHPLLRAATEAEAPPPDFAFDATHHRIRVGRWTPMSITVLAGVPQGDVDFRAHAAIEVRPARVTLEGDGPYLHARVEVRGIQIGASGSLVATSGTRSTECMVEIVSRREDAHLEPGPLGEIRLDASPSPGRRVSVRKSDGAIVIYVNDPSIAAYLAESIDRDSPAGRTLLAELVLEAFCTHIALRRIDPGEAGDSSRAAIGHVDELQRTYGAMVHRLLARP